MKAQAAIAAGADWRAALDEATQQLPIISDGTPIDLTLLFASDEYGDDMSALLAEVRRRIPAGVLVGCSGTGVIGPSREIEGEPAIALQVLSLPGIKLTPAYLTPQDIEAEQMARIWITKLDGVKKENVNAWIFFTDPYSVNGDRLLAFLGTINQGVPLIGGLASGADQTLGTYLFINDNVYQEGAVGVAVGGDYEVRTIVSQGAAPIGEPWTITQVYGNVIESIGSRPAFEVLSETFEALPIALQDRARSNLLIGLAMDEYRDEFNRGDFLIRNLIAVDRESGAIAVGAYPREGQTVQFQLRDPQAADEDLKEMLIRASFDLGGQQPVGALLCSCVSRGVDLFGSPDHDAMAVSERFGALPVAGFFCSGEIGPVARQNYLHGFTASIALILPKATAQA
jgi:small ligand-binding sensory domain FIST